MLAESRQKKVSQEIDCVRLHGTDLAGNWACTIALQSAAQLQHFCHEIPGVIISCE